MVKRTSRFPVVFFITEVKQFLSSMTGTLRLVVSLVNWSRLRLLEALRLRLQDIDFDRNIFTAGERKGRKDGVVPLPQSLDPQLQTQISNVTILHAQDLAGGF